jgi:2-polyprenyl-3-methyl-5-hydroxy-6-metoxy-1,4-benzoquinol methylase
MESQAVVVPRHRLADSAYFYGDVERHSLDGLGTFDICLFCEVIEHLVYDPAWALFNLLKRVRLGGHLILTTPNPARLESISRLILHSGSNADPISGYGIHGRHNREYTLAELHDLLGGSGCMVLRSRTIDVTPRDWSRSAEDRGHGEYLMVEVRVDRQATLYRPAWLYRSFDPGDLQSQSPLHPTSS